MKRISLLVGLAFVVVAVGVSLPGGIRLLVDWWWFGTIGYQEIFTTTVTTKLMVGAVAGLIAFVVFYLNFRTAQRGVVPDPIVVNIKTRASSVDVTKGLRLLSLPASAVLAILVGFSAAGAWLVLQRFLHRTPFGLTDAIFGRDIGYYIFTLPAIGGIISFVQAMAVLSLFLVFPLYLLRGDVLVIRNRATVEPSAQMHIGVLVALLFLASAVSTYFVRIPSLLYSTTGPMLGASHTDLVARLPVLRVLWILAVACSVWVLWGAVRKQLVRHLAMAVIAYFAVSIVAGGVFPAAIQKLIVVPNELAKESPQLEHHIRATRAAWGIDEVEIRQLSGESQLTLEDIRANSGTIRNVRLWDREPLLQTFGQLQEIRTYYDFISVDDDRYWIDGEYRQVLLSPRELNSELLPTRTFINERLTFTHGMGLTLSPVNQVTPEGLPNLFIKDLPPVSTVSLKVTRPEIYFGELSRDYVFVNTAQPEFDFPSGDSSATTVYQGLGGVGVTGTISKAILATRLQSLKVFLSQDIRAGSRVLLYRNLRQRAAKALPFLLWDGDPYMVVTEEGHLKWMLDAYTATDRYPYSARATNGVNYMRNSVKVVIDAYHGEVSAYIADPDDPIIQTYAKIFPGVLLPLSDMPDDLRSHIRYPEDLFREQTDRYKIYHMSEPDVFYHREDQWQIPTVTTREASRDPFLRHIVMKLPGEEREEFIFMTPFTPRQKDNLAAWMVARNDGDRYGQLVVYRFPRQSLIFGPTQIVNRINQNTEISRQISLWDQRGSEVIRGNLLVIPIEEALVFVQALYLRAEGGRIPELKRVVVAYQNQVVMEETLDQGLTRLFGGTIEADTRAIPLTTAATAAVPTIDTEVRELLTDLAQEAANAFDRAVAAQRAGDWAAYGREIQRVGELLQRLRDRAQGS